MNGINKLDKEKKQLTENKMEEKWYEFDLPKAPVPDLNHTFENYLNYAQTLVESYKQQELNFEETKLAVNSFLPLANQLQNKLFTLSETQENWINNFWLTKMYLSQRLPLPVNFNPAYIFPQQNFINNNDYLNYAACLLCGFLDFKDKIDRKAIARDVHRIHVSANFCMDQYDKLLNCYREPGIEIDIQHNKKNINNKFNNSKNEHILVMCNCQTFIVFTRLDGELLSQTAILSQLQKIVEIAENRDINTLVPIAAATVGYREDAAKFWTIMKNIPVNVQSFNWIKEAMFVLCLDLNLEEPIFLNNNCESNLESSGLQILHGFGSQYFGLNRWYDATIQLIVARSGFNGLCIEHSVAEGIVIINMAESALRYTYEKKKQIVSDNVSNSFPSPKSLSWVFNEDSRALLDKEIIDFDELVEDLQLRLLFFRNFGKETIKLLKVSPDGFVQLAMQLAYFRLHHHIVSTYESASIRKFRLGRVDNIRAATYEAFTWVKAMNVKFELLMKAINKQSTVTQENVNGYGIDNHLCALKCLTTEAVKDGSISNMPEFFQQKMYSELMRFPLSTSQVTTSPTFENCYLYYGPVVYDGYGCAYNFQNDKIIFSITAFKSNQKTNAEAFRENLILALNEMKNLLFLKIE